MALSIDGRRDLNLTGQRFVALGAAIGLPERAAKRIVERLAASADGWLDGVDALPFDTRRKHRFKRGVLNRQRLLRQG